MSKWLCRSCDLAFDRLAQMEEHDRFDPRHGAHKRTPVAFWVVTRAHRFAAWLENVL